VATIPNATSSIASTASTGQPPAEPYGTHSTVTMAGAATTARAIQRWPRGENAMTNETR
jgi:hypothetical protein